MSGVEELRSNTEQLKGRPRAALCSLYAAGFTTAFGAHAVAANLAGYGGARGVSLTELGVLLALYDGAEIVLKPVFGALCDRIGAKPVLLGGLATFAAASAFFVLAGEPDALGVARLAQGAAAAAFSPAAGALVSSLGATHLGSSFGSYGAAKGLGYVLGPLVAGPLVAMGGYSPLFIVLSALSAVVAVAALIYVPDLEALPRKRQTVADFVRQVSSPGFIRPVAALAGATAALSAGVGFLPARALTDATNPALIGVIVALLAACAAGVQVPAGRALDARTIEPQAALRGGLVLAGAGFVVLAFVSPPLGLVLSALLIGVGTGLITPLAFALVAKSAPKDRIGQTMGAAEVGRELGDAGGPMLVGALSVISLSTGLAALGLLLIGLICLA